MELSKIQIIALCIITTILTDKFIVSHPSQSINSSNNPPNLQVISTAPTPVSTSSAIVASNISSQNEVILRELINLRKDMSSTFNSLQQQASASAAVPTLSTSLLNGMVKISSPQWKRVNVYESPSTSSKIINSIVYDTIYFYRQKQGDWYQLDLDADQLGWVQIQFLKEFP